MPKRKAKKKVQYLVCVNAEEYSVVALRFVSKMAENVNGTVIVLHVIEPVDYQSIGTVAEKMREEKHAEAEKLLKSLAKTVSDEVGITPVLMIKEGLIEEQILAAVEEYPAINMLVVGSATESAPKSKILPPLVSQAGHKLQIPMLIVPGNLTDQQIEALT